MSKKVQSTASQVVAQEVSDETLAQVGARAFRFLSALAEQPEVRAKLESRGYTHAVHRQGWALLDTLGGRTSLPPARTEVDVVRASTDKVETWAAENLPILEVSLMDHPAQRAFLLPARARGEDEPTVHTVSTLMQRMARLDDDPERKATRKEDHAALAIAAARGIDATACTQMREALSVIQSGSTRDPSTPTASPSRPHRLALHRWLTEWTTITRTLIKSRRTLILLGLARPARAKRPGVVGPTAPVVTPLAPTG